MILKRLVNPTPQILVVGHTANLKAYPKGYIFIQRKSDLKLFHNFPSDYNFNSSGLAWSEYSACFENIDQIKRTEGYAGISHYRCTLNFSAYPFSDAPLFARNIFLRFNLFALRLLPRRIYISEPLNFGNSVFQRFHEGYPQFSEILDYGADSLDEIIGNQIGFSALKLRSTQMLYSRNIIIAPAEFLLAWLDISFAIAIRLDVAYPEPKDDRWGGYILERLFSIYLEQLISDGRNDIRCKPLLYFSDKVAWRSVIATRFKILGRIRRFILN